MNIRNAQQGMRAHQDALGLKSGADGLQKEDFVGPGLWMETEPVCPGGGTYTWMEGSFPVTGELMLRCSHERERLHVPADHLDW